MTGRLITLARRLHLVRAERPLTATERAHIAWAQALNQPEVTDLRRWSRSAQRRTRGGGS